MSKSHRSGKTVSPPKNGASGDVSVAAGKNRLWMVAVALILFGGVAAWTLTGSRRPGNHGTSAPRNATAVTYSRDVAPIMFDHCATCHREGEAAPFALLDYASTRKHIKQIVSATARRYMPPWLAAPGYGEFAHNRSLTDQQIAILRTWYESGMAEGDSHDLPKPPIFSEGWQLGPPDLIVTLPTPFALRSDGRDVYRNLVFPIPLDRSRYVRAVEFHPGNPRILHHAFVNIDETGSSRRLAGRQDPPGFDGMDIPPPASMPAGQFLSWQPGRVPSVCPPGLSWLLRTNTDIVLQMHLHPSGKPETIQPAIGFYFTDQAPTNTAFRLALKEFELNIAPGDSNCVVDESYKIPVDLAVLRVDTHAHYLGKEMKAWAVLPNGEKKWLIWIKDWDFNWQGGYDYASPVMLPRGSEVFMHYVYDNSTNNIRNPSNPPHTVRFGIQTTDEMAELWLQVLASNQRDRLILGRDYFSYLESKTEKFDLFRLTLNPNDPDAHVRLAHNYIIHNKPQEALEHLQAALKTDPGNSKAHHEMASLYLAQNQLADALREFQSAANLDPYDSEAFGNIGYIYARSGAFDKAREALQSAVRINPEDSAAAGLLQQIIGR